MMFHSIRLRLTLSYLLVIVLAMGLLGFLLLSFVQRYFLRAMEESLIAQARITAQTLIPGVVTPGPPIDSQGPAANAVQQQMTSNIGVQTENFRLLPAGPIEPDLAYLSDVSVQLSTQLDTRIRILDSLGIVLVDSQQEQRGTSLLDDPLVEKALSGKYGSRSDWTRGQTPAMHLAMPALLEGKLAAVIYLSQPLRDVVAVLHDLRTRWLWSTGIALALSAAVGPRGTNWAD